MKRIITYISILAAVLTAGVSCTREAIDGNQEGGAITLCFKTEEMGTRVTVEDGENVLGVGAENTIEYVDYFFFADTDPDTPAIKSGRLTIDDLTPVTPTSATDPVTEYKYTFDISDSENEVLKSKSYLYVLVNYPGEVNATTLNSLLSLPITTNFNEEQTSFVMDSYDNGDESGLLKLIPSKKDENKTVVVKLARCAAKLVLNIDVKNTYTDASDNLWTPVTSQMWVNFVNARNRTTVNAEAMAFDDKSFYYTSSQTPPTHTSDKEGYTGWQAKAVYSYPQSFTVSDVTAPYFKIFCPWVCEGKGTNNFYYKILLPQLGSFQRNKIYTMTVDLSVIGSTEDDWALATRHIAVADWCYPDQIEASFEGAMYLDVPVKYYEIYGVNDIYIPVLSSNDIQVTNLQGTKTNLKDGSTVSVSATTSEITKEGFKLTHTLNTDITSSSFDCTPITYTMTVQHKQGGLSKTIDVTVVQYPSIYAAADASNGFAYVNSYANNDVSGGRHQGSMAYNSRGNSSNGNGSDELGSMNYLNSSTSQNNNNNQYIVNVSVLPPNYKVEGMEEDVVIGDPRGGTLTYNYLGYYGNGNSGSINRDVQSKYRGAAQNTQNVIAPSIRIASSWGATTVIRDFNRAEERCAAYQENGYPAGRWRLPTVAEIDFLIMLSTYEHIPALFTTEKATKYTRSGSGMFGYRYTASGDYYGGYWSNGPSIYIGVPYLDGHSTPYALGTGTNVQTTYYTAPNEQGNRYQLSLLLLNDEYFDVHVRCVYDEWYWGPEKYDSYGNKITENGTGTAATQWIGYIF